MYVASQYCKGSSMTLWVSTGHLTNNKEYALDMPDDVAIEKMNKMYDDGEIACCVKHPDDLIGWDLCGHGIIK